MWSLTRGVIPRLGVENEFDISVHTGYAEITTETLHKSLKLIYSTVVCKLLGNLPTLRSLTF